MRLAGEAPLLRPVENGAELARVVGEALCRVRRRAESPDERGLPTERVIAEYFLIEGDEQRSLATARIAPG